MRSVVQVGVKLPSICLGIYSYQWRQDGKIHLPSKNIKDFDRTKRSVELLDSKLTSAF